MSENKKELNLSQKDTDGKIQVSDDTKEQKPDENDTGEILQNTEEKKNNAVVAEGADFDHTMFFTRTDIDKQVRAAEKAGETEDSLQYTRHFSLRTKGKKASGDKNKKNFMQNFRVLSKNREDRTILEALPDGKGGRAFADTVKAQKGEDIFEAVEKAFVSKKKNKDSEKDKSYRKSERREKDLQQGEELKQELEKAILNHRYGMIAYGVLFIIALVLLTAFYNTAFYGAAGIVLFCAACGLSYPAFVNAFRAIKSFNAVSDTSVVVMSFFVFIHNISAIMLGQPDRVYTICIIFAFFARLCSKYFRLKSRQKQVSMVLGGRGVSMLQRIPIKKDAVSFAKNTHKNDEPDIFYCTGARLDKSLGEPEDKNIRENKYFIFTMSFVLLASLAAGLLSFTSELTGFSFIRAFTACVCILLPVMYDPVSRIIFYRKSDELLRQGVCISGREALTHIGRSDGFVLDAKDVFTGEVSRFRKSAVSDMAQSDSAVFAALLIREAGSVLAPCFDSFLEQMNIELPDVENFLYEERLGYSAWVLDRKVLVGNRQMLLNHSISVPSKEQEKAYGKGRYVMYVVIDGEVTATFLVSYKVHSSLKRYSRDFNKTGLVLMLTSKEAFLDEETVSGKLSIDASSVKVLSSKAATIMEKYNSRYDKQTSSGLLCSGKGRSIMHLIMGCYNANASDRLILIMMLLGQLSAFIVLALSAVLKMKLIFNPIAIVALRILWGFITGFITERKK